MEKIKKSYSTLGMGYLVPYFGYMLIMIIYEIIISKTVGEGVVSGDLSIIINYAIRVLLLYPVMYLAIRKVPKFEIKKNKLGFGGFIACICITYAIMVICNGVGIMINNAIGRITGLGNVNPLLQTIDVISPGVQVVVVVILAPICEELLFRKFIVDRIVNYSEVVAMLLSGVMFGLYHGNLAQFMYAFGLGVFFAFIYIRTGKIIYTIILHMIVNGFGTFFTKVLLGGINMTEFMNVYSSGDSEAITEYAMEHADTFAMAGLAMLVVFAVIFAGVILMIALHKKFVFEHHEEEIEKGKRFQVAILNPGMLTYIIFWVVVIVTTQVGVNIFDSIYELFG
ncbi:MAG: CPBP family intramembrane metalloprotease [Butyrivibrio sp.]|nr:CPBP family intramembrane metalloprotease [Butyrivibrio sp.]